MVAAAGARRFCNCPAGRGTSRGALGPARRPANASCPTANVRARPRFETSAARRDDWQRPSPRAARVCPPAPRPSDGRGWQSRVREPSWCGNNPAPRPKPPTPHTTGNGSFAVQNASPARRFFQTIAFALNLSHAVGQRLSKLKIFQLPTAANKTETKLKLNFIRIFFAFASLRVWRLQNSPNSNLQAAISNPPSEKTPIRINFPKTDRS